MMHPHERGSTVVSWQFNSRSSLRHLDLDYDQLEEGVQEVAGGNQGVVKQRVAEVPCQVYLDLNV